MTRRVSATPAAARQFDRLPADVRQRFLLAFDALVKDPFSKDVAPLHGVLGSFRLRVGSYRGIFHAAGDEVVFTRFGHRSTVYR
jgi:mRNA-degrading endonuclease RelE of RelBE toxin-antitoxin system